MRGRAGAKRAPEPGGEGTRRFRGGKQHLGAALTPGILRAPAARHSVPAAVTRAATPPTATAPTAIKRRFSHFQRLCWMVLKVPFNSSHSVISMSLQNCLHLWPVTEAPDAKFNSEPGFMPKIW